MKRRPKKTTLSHPRPRRRARAARPKTSAPLPPALTPVLTEEASPRVDQEPPAEAVEAAASSLVPDAASAMRAEAERDEESSRVEAAEPMGMSTRDDPEAVAASREEAKAGGPIRSRLHDLLVRAPGQSGPTRVIPAHEQFEMQLGLELRWAGARTADRVLCQVSVGAHRLGEGERWLVARFTQALTPETSALDLRLGGIPLPPGLYRFEASARLDLGGEAPGSAAAYLDAGLVTVY